MKTFIEVQEEYDKLRHTVEHTLEKLGHYCSDFVNNNIELFEGVGDYIDNPYSLYYEEEYESHFYEGDTDLFYVNFEYKDPYDDILDTTSSMRCPARWVEEAFKDTLENIDEELTNIIIRKHHEDSYMVKRKAIMDSASNGVITLEESKEKLRELDASSKDYWLTQKKN